MTGGLHARRDRAWVAIAAALAVLNTPTAAHAAGPEARAAAASVAGAVSGVPKLPKRKRLLAEVQAIHVETGEVLSARTPGRSLRYRFSLRRGAYLVDAFVAHIPGKRAYGGLSRLVRVGARGRWRANVRTRRLRKDGVRAAAAPRVKDVAISPNSPIAGAAIHPKAVGRMLATDVFRIPCPPGTSEINVIASERRDELLEEIRRTQSPEFDPGTRLSTDKLITPRYRVSAGGSASGGGLTLRATMRKISNGKVVAEATATGSLEDFFKLEEELAKRLVEEACKPELPDSYAGSVNATADNGFGTREGWTASNVVYEADGPRGLYSLSGGSVNWSADISVGECSGRAGPVDFSLAAPDGYDQSGPPTGGVNWDLSTRTPRYQAFGIYGKQVVATLNCPEGDPFQYPYNPLPHWFASDDPADPSQEFIVARADSPLAGSTTGSWNGFNTVWNWSLEPRWET